MGKMHIKAILLIAIMVFLNLNVKAQRNSDQAKGSPKTKVMLAQTPPLGWNSFDSYGIAIYEEIATKELDAFIEKFAPHGYEYFVIDNGWFAAPKTKMVDGYMVSISDKDDPAEVSVDEYGIPSPSKLYFPNGLKPLIDKTHAKGLKFGVHLMRGIPRVAVERNLPIKGTNYTAKDIYTTFDNCTWCIYMHGVDMAKPGSQEYYNSVFKKFAEWEIDFVKVDNVTQFPAEVEGYIKAIEQCGRPIVLSLSAGGKSNISYLETYRKSNMVRNTPDIWDEQLSIDRSFESMRKWQGLEKPGFWPDLDMIPFGELCILNRADVVGKDKNKPLEELAGKMHHWCKFTEPQKETFLTQRAISASPIFIGGSMISIDEHSYQLLTHPEMLACVKNGVHGTLIHTENNIELWSAPVANKERYGYQEYMYKEGWAAFFNRSDKAQTVEVKGRFLNFMQDGTYILNDILGKQSVKNYKKGSPLSLTIEPNGVAFFKYSKVQP